MALDIMSISAEKALKQLGHGDWEVTGSCLDMVTITIEAEWRENVVEKIADMFVRWVLRGQEVEITHRNDPYWDRSGELRYHDVDPLILLTKYETLGDWMQNARTGHSRATYTSGCGLHWDFYESEVDDIISTEVYHLLEAQFAVLYASELDTEDEFWEHPKWAEWEDFCVDIEPILVIEISAITTESIWEEHHHRVLDLIDEENRIREEQRKITKRQWQLASDFWHQHFEDATAYQKIEKPQFHELKIETRLTELLLDTDPEIVKAIARLGVPGWFSGSVEGRIKGIAGDALK
ncbi:MAG: hypothetical protein AAFQ07_08935 [Chloroflexota bacterium]